MSRKYHIRWQKSDTEELSKAVRNFNAKISRIEQKYPELKNALPEKVRLKGYKDEKGNYIPGLKEIINTRQDLKREINALKRFTNKNNRITQLEDGSYQGIEIYGDYSIKLTKWQIKELNRKIGIINRRKKRRLDALMETKVKSRGEEQGYTVAQIGVGSIQYNDLQPMTGLTPGASEESVRRKYKSATIQVQSDFLLISDFRLKRSYITSLYQNFSEEDVKDIIAAIENMSVEEFMRIYNSDNDAKFEGTYPGSKKQEKQYAESLRAVWMPNR